MADLDARADRVRAIADGNFGRVIGCEGDIMHVEVPADLSIGLNAVRGTVGVVATVYA